MVCLNIDGHQCELVLTVAIVAQTRRRREYRPSVIHLSSHLPQCQAPSSYMPRIGAFDDNFRLILYVRCPASPSWAASSPLLDPTPSLPLSLHLVLGQLWH